VVLRYLYPRIDLLAVLTGFANGVLSPALYLVGISYQIPLMKMGPNDLIPAPDVSTSP
jgi:hypothetical protein